MTEMANPGTTTATGPATDTGTEAPSLDTSTTDASLGEHTNLEALRGEGLTAPTETNDLFATPTIAPNGDNAQFIAEMGKELEGDFYRRLGIEPPDVAPATTVAVTQPATTGPSGTGEIPVTNAEFVQGLRAAGNEFTAIISAATGGPQVVQQVQEITGAIFREVAAGKSLPEAVSSLSASNLMILSASLERELANPDVAVTEDLQKLQEAVQLATTAKITSLVQDANRLDRTLNQSVADFDAGMQSVDETFSRLREIQIEGGDLTEVLKTLSEDQVDALYVHISNAATANPEDQGIASLNRQVGNFAFYGAVERPGQSEAVEPAGSPGEAVTTAVPESEEPRQQQDSAQERREAFLRLDSMKSSLFHMVATAQPEGHIRQTIANLPEGDRKAIHALVERTAALPNNSAQASWDRLKELLDTTLQ